MKKHTRIYLKFFGYCETDVIMCEIPNCNRKANDIHHIECRGIGGSKTKDTIENLQAICREHHLEYGDKKQYKQFLNDIHKNIIEAFVSK